MQLAHVLVHDVGIELSGQKRHMHHVLHIREPQMLHPLEHSAVDRLGVIYECSGLRLDVCLAADLQEGRMQDLPLGFSEQGPVQIDPANEFGIIQAQGIGCGSAQGMARCRDAAAKVDEIAVLLPGVSDGVQGVLLPGQDPADDELAVAPLQLVEPLRQLPVIALRMGQPNGLDHAAQKGIVLLFGEL